MLKKKPDLEQIRAIISQLQSKPDLTSTEMSELALAESRLDKLVSQNSITAEPTAPLKVVVGDPEAFKTSEVGEVIRLPIKHVDDNYLRLEQNLGCELPVCAGNRRDVNKPAIEMRTNDDVSWRLERTANSLLPAPEHYSFWLWILNQCQAAARLGCIEAPKIPINLAQLARDLNRKPDGRWYDDADEAFSRFSRMVITAGQSLHMTGTGYVVSNTGAFGTLCNYVSRRTTRPSQRQLLVDGVDGWVQPGTFLWNSVRSGYLKAVPLLPMRNLQSYVAQRLFLYLSKHCQPGGHYKVSLSKMLPKIPMRLSKNSKEKLIPHHKALLDLGFLASEPIYEGRGAGLMVTYERAVE